MISPFFPGPRSTTRVLNESRLLLQPVSDPGFHGPVARQDELVLQVGVEMEETLTGMLLELVLESLELEPFEGLLDRQLDGIPWPAPGRLGILDRSGNSGRDRTPPRSGGPSPSRGSTRSGPPRTRALRGWRLGPDGRERPLARGTPVVFSTMVRGAPDRSRPGPRRLPAGPCRRSRGPGPWVVIPFRHDHLRGTWSSRSASRGSSPPPSRWRFATARSRRRALRSRTGGSPGRGRSP